ncbi:MAG: hypothetical protein LBU42_01555 [Prevotellaceae bacterium]|jgi:ElaB/YqjD/DUF883 family membrane-anchored ribosome-binding protein|nr:hypothetical protein [Prevotellaceae bacterium]
MFESKSYSFRLSPELAEQLNALLPESGANGVSGIREALEMLVQRAAGPTAPASPVTEAPEYVQLQTVLNEAREQVEAIRKDYDALTAQYDELLKSHDAGHDALKQRAEVAETALQEAREALARTREAAQLPGNAMVLELDNATAAMLSETCERLAAAAEHYPQLKDFADVTPGVLLVSMFRRYVKERRTEWFFPLSILPPERIEEIEQL